VKWNNVNEYWFNNSEELSPTSVFAVSVGMPVFDSERAFKPMLFPFEWFEILEYRTVCVGRGGRGGLIKRGGVILE